MDDSIVKVVEITQLLDSWTYKCSSIYEMGLLHTSNTSIRHDI